MKIAIMGSTQFRERMWDYAETHELHECRLPAFDDHKETSLEIMQHNLDLIKWADEVHLFWDCRSPGAWGDWCMAFALGKPVKPVYLEPKSMADAVREYGR